MIGEVYLIAAGVGGAVVGFIIGKMTNEGTTSGKNSFSTKEMQRWNINQDWANILDHKKSKEVAQKALDDLNQGRERALEKRKDLRKKQDKVIEDIAEVGRRHKEAKSSVERKLIVQRMGDITAESSSVRREFDNVSNRLIVFEKSKRFLESVIDGFSFFQIKQLMNDSNLVEGIKRNEGEAMNMFKSEMEQLEQYYNEAVDAIKDDE